MDPVGPWYASYNRLAGVQAGAASGDFHHHLTGSGTALTGHNPAGGVPSTTGQLLLQAAHTTASQLGQLGSSTASPFNPGGFLSPSPVGYDPIFSPLFHHANPKPAHYSSTINAQHRQALVQAQAAAASKQATESELSTSRETYSHHQSLAAAQGSTFFDQSSAPGSASGLAWQGNNQLPSPFGILPHESVVPSSPSPATTKSSSSAPYEGFNVHFAAAQTLNNHLSSQLVANANKVVRSASPQVTPPVKPVPSQAPTSVTGTFFQAPATFGNSSENISSYSTTNAKTGPISAQQEYTPSGSKSFSSTGTSSSSHLNQQSCIVSISASETSPSKEYRLPITPSRPSSAVYAPRSEKSPSSNFVPPPSKTSSNSQIQTKAQSKVYAEVNHIEHRRNSDNSPQDTVQPQSSPISYSIVDPSSRVNYNTNNNTAKSAPARNGSQYALNQQNVTYRHYQNPSNVETEYNSRNKNSNSNDVSYAGSNNQNGPDCGVVVPRRPSPLQAHSQASPLGHVPSPAYPMYNSPMNSISSPQQHSDSSQNSISYKSGTHVAPRSPLDVTVSRSASQGNQVAYPSVITRTLTVEQTSKPYHESRFEHSQPQSQQNCWDDDRQQNKNSRKFPPGNANYNGSSNNVMDNVNRSNDAAVQSFVQQSPSQRPLSANATEKQSFYDNPINSRDLASCRGDPMSIVKNLQTLQQQTCQVQEQTKSSVKANLSPVVAPTSVAPKNSVRRKSSEKQVNHSNQSDAVSVTVPEYLTSRIPPPAHSSTSNQQQNGTYYELERWNLPPPPPKMFAGGPTAYSSQSPLHSSNFSTQHQSLMVHHPHSHTPLSYFPLHLQPHPTDFQSSVELAPLTPYNNSTPVTTSTSEIRDGEQPKVVVPNIEEELGFLAEQRANSTAPTPTAASHQSTASSISSPQETSSKIPEKKLTVPAAGSSFMASYLKFLQGERDTSPPPASRGGRKATWSRSNSTNNKTYNEQINPKTGEQQNIQNSNGTMPTSGSLNSSVSMNTPSVLSPVSNMSSPGSISAPGSINALGVMGLPSSMISLPSVTKSLDNQDDSRYFPLPKDRKRKFDGMEEGYDANEDEARRLNKPVLNVPSTPLNEKGKKGRSNVSKAVAVVAPPQGTTAPKKPRPAVQPSLPAMQAQSHQQYYYQQPDEAAAHGAGIDYTDYSSEDENSISKKLNQQRTLHHSTPIIQQTMNPRPGEEIPYQAGEFLAIKAELSEAWPAIWRVDGKNLLQKFEPFDQNGNILYRSISTYIAWNSENKKLYIQVPVRMRIQNHTETVVELMRNEDDDFVEKRMQDTATYQDNFEVYIQTLISHALDPNFLTEIFQEQDEYFLSNVKTVDDITEERRRRIAGTGLMWSRSLEMALNTWPCLNSTELAPSTTSLCSSCRISRATHRLQLYGQPYNPATLEPCQPDPRMAYEKEMVMCRPCANKVELFSRISHQKYLMFGECNKRVAEKRLHDPHKDTTLILNELLADEPWLSQLFRDVRQSWAEAEFLERSRQMVARQLI
ncbi:uncharacterized protein LOC143910943 isoform X2 [Arctopsyche grandis]|uniref:uncharacterized protein LOC143910943 isoform X2 n=1 Tax=Arctopsyche grandis TaxID=121162 RepID=UPI00406D951E